MTTHRAGVARIPFVLGAVTAFLLSCATGSTGSAQDPSSSPDSSVQVPPSEVLVGGNPCGLTRLNGDVWVTDLGADRIVKIDATARVPVATFPVGSSPCWLVGHRTGIWVAPSEERSIQIVDPITGQVTNEVEISSAPADAKLELGFGDLWATSTPDGDVVRIDLEQREIVARIHVGIEPRSVVTGGGLVWVAVEGSNRVVAIDPQSNRVVRRFRVRAPSSIVAATKRRVWVGQLRGESATKLDARDGRVLRIYRLEANLSPGVVINEEIWSPDHLHSEVLLFPLRGGTPRPVEVGTYPSSLLRIDQTVWVANFGDGTISIVDIGSE